MDIFKVGVYIKDLNCDLAQLRDFALWCEKNESNSKKSNLSGYQSNNLAKSLDVIKPLVEQLDRNVKTYCDTLKLNKNLKLANQVLKIALDRPPLMRAIANIGNVSETLVSINEDKQWSKRRKEETTY